MGFGANTHEFHAFTREFGANTREFHAFTREFGANSREFHAFTRSLEQILVNLLPVRTHFLIPGNLIIH
ncbi:hypothetical protein EI200_13885 [Peribacillus simplex]|uniref:hypothetical protein n=1 Tax=Peribacillus simplex TaxID=1478 RepID=UPI000F63BB42|nr:hypothetical protein [Peribacillus simplex]RRN70556.1 hypothetical protein EI200_13885 [Peribacillus simplex]